MDALVYEKIPQEDLYARTGIQKQIFNSIYQLMAHKTQEAELLGKAKTFLMIPDYFHFLLTGVKKQEYTNASTTQLVNAKTNDWDYDLIAKLGYPRDIFLPIEMPGTEVGHLSQTMQDQVGFDCSVVRQHMIRGRRSWQCRACRTIRSISVPAHGL